MTDSHSVTDDSAATTPGRRLKSAREAAGFSVQYVAEQLRLTESYIAWLETDQYEHLPAEPFVLGYYRAYARVLSLSADELIDVYHQYRGQQSKTGDESSKLGRRREAKVARKESPLDTATKPSNANRNYLIAAAVLVIIWIAVSLLSDKQPTEVSTLSTPASESTTATDVSGDPASEDLSGLEGGSERDSIEQANASLVNDDELAAQLNVEENHPVDSNVTEAASAIEGTSADSPLGVEETVSNGLDQLWVSFGGECWLEVIDAQGDVVAADLYQKDDVAKIQGVAPFAVMLGNVRVAKMTVNNNPVDASPRGFRKTLRVSVFSDGASKALD